MAAPRSTLTWFDALLGMRELVVDEVLLPLRARWRFFGVTAVDNAAEKSIDITFVGSGNVPETRDVIAGAGLVGGGTLDADRTFAVAAADASIAVTADAIAVGVLQSDAQHGELGGGALHSDAGGAASGFMSAADKTRLDAATENATNDTLVQRGADGVRRQIRSAIGETQALGDELSNPTAAAAGVQQNSPVTSWKGKGWAEGGGGASHACEWGVQMQPVQAAGLFPEAQLAFMTQIDGGGWTTRAWLTESAGIGNSAFFIDGDLFASFDGHFGGTLECGDDFTCATTARAAAFSSPSSSEHLDLYAGTDKLVRIYADEGGTLVLSIGEDGTGTLFDFGSRPLMRFAVTGGPGEFVAEDADGDLIRCSSGTAVISSEMCNVLRLGLGDLTVDQSLGCTGQVFSPINDVAFTATPAFDFSTSNHQRLGALTANVTSVGVLGVADGAIYTIDVVQDATGGRTITGWSANFVFPAGLSTPDAAANARTIWTFRSNTAGKILCIGRQTGLV